jgi:aromatic-amino-acid transaminase
MDVRMIHIIPSHQTRPSDDPIFAAHQEATARRARGEALVNATVGTLLDEEGRLAVLPTAARAVHEVAASEWAGYAPIAGSLAFLDAVKSDLFAHEPEMRACAIASATAGGTGALRHAIANFLEPGQELLTTSFFWGPYQTLADETDRKVATFQMFGPDGNLDAAALDRSLGELIARQGRALLFLNDPCHNPTGYSMRPEEWHGVVERLLAHAEKAPLTLLVDTAYSAYGARDPRAFLTHLRPLLGKAGLCFAWSASKSFTHYGLRVGAIVACLPDERERAKTEAAFSYSSRGTWSNCNHGGQVAITRLLTDPVLARQCDLEREGFKKVLRTRIDAFNELAPRRRLRYPRYEGGFFVTVFCDDAPERALRMKKEGVFVVPQKGAVRVALCSVAERDVRRLVDSLAG